MSLFILNATLKWRLVCKGQKLAKFKCLRCLNTFENVKKEKEEERVALKPAYYPSEVEAKWYELWESKNYFKPTKSESETFAILLPPPNITGTLHLGHALTCTIQDVIIRWKRMKGESVQWIPGMDHAGIATQVAVEKHLQQTSGLSRYDLGKEEFIKTIWKWKNEKETKIVEQLRKLGVSLDWSNLVFTLDSSHSDLIIKSFIQLYNDGLIYRKESLVNWSCTLKSSISDMEVDWIEIDKKTDFKVPGYEKPITFGKIYEFAYKFCDEDKEIVVATTRPETMLGDTAVAIHPDHPEASNFEKKFVWHPFRNEKIPIIVDEFVDPKFGTGAVKITPSHSLADFQVGLKHKLKSISVINEDGFISNVATNEKFHGLKRFDARWAIINELKNLNLFRGSKSHSMTLPVCSRSGDVVEFLSKKQWFLKCDGLRQKAVNAVKNGDLKMTPEFYKNVWYEWLHGKPVEDWNLSRQLWWGHQIPMFECKHEEKSIWVPGSSLEEAKSRASEMLSAPAEEINVVQDPDVLDTWFSSGLLSLNPMVGQQRKPPISLMVTGHDILFFWLARMVMLSIQLTGQLPFKEVLLHGLICDSTGKKMSKSVGNVIHPDDILHGLSKSEMENRLNISLERKEITPEIFKKTVTFQKVNFPKGIPECGADALRFTLCSSNTQGSSINFDFNVCLANKFFGNKIYQAFNYFLKITDGYKAVRREFDLENPKIEKEKLNSFDLWILSRLANVLQIVDESLTSFKFDVAADAIRFFIINEFCNFYLTSTKAVLENASSVQFKTTISVFFHCFETSLRLLSPFMPYLTEYLYKVMPSLKGYSKWESITIAKFPESEEWNEFRDHNLEFLFKKISNFLTALRKEKITFNMKSERPNILIKCEDEVADLIFSDIQPVLTKMGDAKKFSRIGRLDKNNLIRVEVDQDFTAFIEHNYDKKSLENLAAPAMGKEEELKERLKKLLKTTKSPEWEDLLPNEKFQCTKQINNVESELKKIENLKFAVGNCDRKEENF